MNENLLTPVFSIYSSFYKLQPGNVTVFEAPASWAWQFAWWVSAGRTASEARNQSHGILASTGQPFPAQV